MNERIRELMIQSMVETGRYQDVQKTYEKFAELIVRECAGIASEYDAPKMSGPGMIIANRIESHFGVEE